MTLAGLYREYDVWNCEVTPCTKAAVGVAARSLLAFYQAMWRQENGVAAPEEYHDVAVADISPRDVSRWRAWLTGKSVSPHTVHSYHAALRQLFRYGLELSPPLIGSDPTEGVRNKRPSQPEPDVWTRDEIAALLRAVRRIRWQDSTASLRWTAILYGLLHGMRINEVTTLRQVDLSPDRRLVLVRAREDVPGQWWSWRTKSSRDRPVGTSPQYARVLHRLMRVCPWMYPHLSRRVCARRVAGIGSLTWRQRQQPYTTVNRDFDVIVEQANVIRMERGQPTIAVAYPHMGRQTAATELAANRVHPKVAAAIMGWSSPETGNRHYIKVSQSQAIAVAQDCFAAKKRPRNLGIKDSNLD